MTGFVVSQSIESKISVEFKSKYRAARREVVEKSISEVQSAMDEAVRTLKRNLSCGSPSAEIRAAQIIIDAGIRGTETVDILERIETLENAYQK